MRILQLAQKPQRRGAEVFASQLSRVLRRYGHEVRVGYLYPHSGPGGLRVEGNDSVLGGDELHRCERFPGFHPVLLRRLMNLIDEFEPDVVQVNGARTVKYGALAKLFKGGSSWALIYRNIGNPQHWMRHALHKYLYENVIMPQLDGVVGVSKATLQVVRDFYSLSVPMTQIPRGVDSDALVLSASATTIREEARTPIDAPVIVYVGSLTAEKRLDRLLRVFHQAHEQIPTLHLWLVGDGPLRQDLASQAASLGIPEHTHFLGVRQNVADFISAATLLLLTSDTEGMPGVILEAGSLGRPAIATRVGGVAECIVEGLTGLLFSPTDEKGLADATVNLLEDVIRRERMGDAARESVEEHFSLRTIAQRYLAFYSDVLASKRRVPSGPAPFGTSAGTAVGAPPRFGG